MRNEKIKNKLRPTVRRAFRGLHWLERRILPVSKLRFSPTFIISPPRSGSTLLYQLVAHSLSISYITYLTGRFRVQHSPAIPFFTAKLAKTLGLVERHEETFESYYGYGKGWGGPHPGLEIWDHWFPDGYVGAGELSESSQHAVFQTVTAIERVFHRPFVNKGQKHSVRIQALVEIFPNALFIQCLRDPLAMAQSILIARTRDFPYMPHVPEDPVKEWFSVKPKEYDEIKNKGLIEQVCEQVYYIERNIADDRIAVGEDRFHFVNYRDLCQNPRQEINKIAIFMSDHGASTRIIRPTPSSFKYSGGCRIDKNIYFEMKEYLEKLYVRQMEVACSS